MITVRSTQFSQQRSALSSSPRFHSISTSDKEIPSSPSAFDQPTIYCPNRTQNTVMHTAKLGMQLLTLCGSEENKYHEVKELLENLSKARRREVLKCRDEVSLRALDELAEIFITMIIMT